MEDQKIEEDLDFFLSNNASQPKKICDEKNQAVQHDQDKAEKLFEKHSLRRSKGRRFTWQKLCI